jgi:hypothetical protein
MKGNSCQSKLKCAWKNQKVIFSTHLFGLFGAYAIMLEMHKVVVRCHTCLLCQRFIAT